jgi:hypothetical protein
MVYIVKKVIKKAFHQVGLDIRYIQAPNSGQSSRPRPIFDDMMEALHYQRGGKEAAFYCPLNQSAHPVGFNFRDDAWHPFVETLKEYQDGKVTTYEGSTLKKFFDNWRPQNAHEALVGFENAPSQFKEFPPHLFHLTPWLSKTPSEKDKQIRRVYRNDHAQHGLDDLGIEGGCKHYGPVSRVKGQLEFDRLVGVYRSLKDRGYDRKHGDVRVRPVKQGSELIFLNRGGYHRMAAMVALGYEKVPARFANPWFIDVEDVDYWPQVRRGLWSREEALLYVDHLFNFRSKRWVQNQGLL